MPTGIGNESAWLCPTLDFLRINTGYVTDLIGGACLLANMESTDWVADKTSQGLWSIEVNDGTTTNEYIDGPAMATMDNVSKVSISFWYHRSTSGKIAMFGKFNSNIGNCVYVSTDGYVYFWVGTNAWGRVLFDGTATNSGWHHIVLVFDGTATGDANRLKGYIDGVAQTLLFTSGNAIPALTPNPGVTLCAGFKFIVTALSHAKYDDMRVYAGTAISPANVATLFSARGITAAEVGVDNQAMVIPAREGMENAWAVPNHPYVRAMDYFSYRRRAIERVSDRGTYDVTLDAAWPSWQIYDSATRPSRDDAEGFLIELEQDMSEIGMPTLAASATWTPDALTNGCYWFDPKPGYVFSDALGTVLAEVGGTALSMRCRATGLLLPFSSARLFQRGMFGSYELVLSANAFATLTGHTLSNTEFFFSMGFKKSIDVSLEALIGSQLSSGGTQWLFGASNPTYFSGVGSPNWAPTIVHTLDNRENTWSCHYTGSTATAYSGFYTAAVTTAGNTSVFNQPLYLFRWGGGQYATGRFTGCVIARGATTEDERRRCILWNAQQVDNLVVGCVGNSLTAGVVGQTSYPNQLLALLQAEFGSNVRVHNFGVGGSNDEYAWDHYPERVANIGGIAQKVMIIWGGTNAIGTDTVRESVNWVWKVCDRAKREGWAVIVFGCIDRDEASLPKVFKPQRIAFNQLLRKEWPLHADYYYDLSERVELSSPSNATYITPDLIHLTTAGGGVVAEAASVGIRYCIDRLPIRNLDVLPTLNQIADRIELTEDNIRGTDDDTLKTLSDQMDQIETGGGGAGEFTVSVEVTDEASGAPIRGALVTLLEAGEVVGWKYSSALGIAPIPANAGSYTINVSASGFDSVSGQAVTVTTSLDVSVEMDRVTIDAPAAPGLCTVRFAVLESNGVDPIEGCKVKVHLSGFDNVVPENLVSIAVHSGTTNEDGFVDLVMIRRDAFTSGGIYEVKVIDRRDRTIYERCVYVPNQATAFASELIEA